MTRGWWRRNAVGVGALVVLLPATALAVGGNEWAEYFEGRAASSIVAEESGSVDLDGITWGPVRAILSDDVSRMTAPADTRLVIAAVPVDPGEGTAQCEAPRLVEQSTGRQWNEARTDLGIGHSADEPANCTGGMTEPFTMYVVYVVPDDAEGPFWIDVPTQPSYPSFPRFPVDPESAD